MDASAYLKATGSARTKFWWWLLCVEPLPEGDPNEAYCEELDSDSTVAVRGRGCFDLFSVVAARRLASFEMEDDILGSSNGGEDGPVPQ